MARNGRRAGPCSTAPVVAAKTAPWHGHWNCDAANCTGHPWCVHVASNATNRPREGWSTYAGSPVAGSVNEAAPPTGTAAAGPIGVPGTAAAAVDGGAGLVG